MRIALTLTVFAVHFAGRDDRNPAESRSLAEGGTSGTKGIAFTATGTATRDRRQ